MISGLFNLQQSVGGNNIIAPFEKRNYLFFSLLTLCRLRNYAQRWVWLFLQFPDF